jgi:hypothetical protein
MGETLLSTFPLPSHSPQKAPGLASFNPSLRRTAAVVVEADDFVLRERSFGIFNS